MLKFIVGFIFASTMLYADTPPPTSVKAKTYSGDGVTPITATGSSLNVNITGGGTGGGTVDQGNAGSQSWLVNVTNTVPVTGTFFQATQPVSGPLTDTQLRASAVPVSAASLPLPSGAATSALQTSGNASLTSIDGKTPALGQALAAASVPVVLTASQLSTLTPLSSVAVTQSTSPWVTSISGTVPLPTGAATEASLAKLTLTQGSTTSGQSGPLTQGAVSTAAPSYTTAQTSPLSLTTAGALRTDSSAVTQPISAASLPLPSGAATSALQTSGNSSLSSIDTKTPALGQALAASSVPVVLTASQLSTLTPLSTVTANIGTSGSLALDASVTGLQVSQGSTTSGQKGGLTLGAVTTAAPAYTTAQSSPLSLTTGGLLRVDASGSTIPISGTIAATQSGTWNITNVSGTVSLPTGAATSALQTTGNTSLSSIDTKTPALGQALAAASVPVVLTASQLSTLTPLSTVAATQSGTWNINNVSGTVSLPTGASTETTLAKLTQTQGSTTSGQSGPLMQGAVTTASPSYTTAQTSPLSLTTAGALRVDASSSTQPVSGTVTANQGGTWNITNVSGTVSLPTGAATSALQTTGNSSLSSIDTKTPALGQALAAASTPVVLTAAQITTLTPLSTVAVTQSTSPWVNNTSQINGVTPLMGNGVTGTGSQRVTIASDNTAFTVNAAQSGTWNINNVSGTVSLPTGAATAANQLLAPKSVTGTQVTGTVSTVITLSAPSNAIGFVLQAADANTANMRYRVGSTATTTSGQQLQAGRDTGYIPLGANISIVAESGTQEYEVQWVAQ